MADSRKPEKRGEPAVALLLTWFLPGSGHLYLGRTVFAAAAFLLIESLFVLGLVLSDGRTFEFLDPELRGPLATILTPEAGNLGGLIWQLQRHGFGADTPGPWPAHIMLGTWLCALSGLLNVCLMVHAHVEARSPRGHVGQGLSPAVHVGLAWLVPGLGHLLQGRRLRALVVFLLLVGLFAWGTWLAGGSNLSRERHFYYWSGQFLAGLPALAGEFLSGRPRVTGEMPLGDVGLLFACMAGLLNVLAMLDVCGVAEKRWLGTPPEPASPTSSGPTEPAGEREAAA